MRLRSALGASERHSYRVVTQHHSTQRKVAPGKADEAILTASIIEIEQWRVHYQCCEASQLFAAEISCT